MFYEVEYTNSFVDDIIIEEEIHQLANIDLTYCNLGFISKTGFNTNYIYITLKDIYDI